MISNFIDAMTRMLQFYHYCLIFTSSYIGFMFIPAAELRGIQINKVDAVNNGIEALQAIERGNYYVVLMDIRMPEMNGLEATKLIRQRWHNGPKIVAVNAYGLDGDREKSLAAGMDDYISKPIKMGELKSLLEKYQSRYPTIA